MAETNLIQRFKDFLAGVEKEVAEPINFEAKAKDLETKLSEATSKIVDFESLKTKHIQLESEKAKLDSELKAANEKLGTFDARVDEAASLKAQTIMAGLGVPPASGGNGGDAPKDFSAMLAAEIKGGKGKEEAIKLCISKNPQAYAEWRNSGKTQTL